MHEELARHLFKAEVDRVVKLAGLRDWIVHATEFPAIEVTFRAAGRTPLRVRMDCAGSPREPVGFELRRADGTALPPGPSPEIHPNPTAVLHQGPHTAENRPFVCTPGSREYHTHESHLDVSWDSFRAKDDFRPAAMLTQVWRAWEKGTG